MITRIPGNSRTLINVKKRNQKASNKKLKQNKQQTVINVKKAK